MKKKVNVNDLRVGMYLDGVDASWFRTPFLKHHFPIKERNQIQKILDAGIKYAYIDTSKGLDVASEDSKKQPSQERLVKQEPVEMESPVSVKPQESAKTSREDIQSREIETLQYSSQKEALFQIEKTTLYSGNVIDFQIFVKQDMSIVSLVEYKGEEIKIDEKIINSNGELLINFIDLPKYKQYLKNVASGKSGDPETIKKRNMVLRENSKILIKEIFNNPQSGEKIKECEDAVENIVDNILGRGGVASNLLSIDNLDYYTYTHSVNVCVMSIGLAMKLGISDSGELYAIGLGTLLHDIGKSTITPVLLNKPKERLTTFEENMVKQHVAEGNNLLKLFKGIPDKAFYPLLEHHETISGEGFPRGLRGGEMHISGKIAAVTNAYDELTTGRPNKPGMSPFEALIALKNSDNIYDPDILKEFVKMLGELKS